MPSPSELIAAKWTAVHTKFISVLALEFKFARVGFHDSFLQLVYLALTPKWKHEDRCAYICSIYGQAMIMLLVKVLGHLVGCLFAFLFGIWTGLT